MGHLDSPPVVDTHAHLSVCEPDDAELVAAAGAAGVDRILTIGTDEESNRAAVGAAERFDAVFACVGRHPSSAAGFDDRAAAALEELAADPLVRAIGETGLDYYRDRAPREDQRAAFAAQVEIAERRRLPVVIHVRDRDGSSEAVDEVFATLDRMKARSVVLHCFSAPGRVADAAERGWLCSFAGNLTYSRSDDLRRAAAELPPELLLAETDAPFLSPQSLRGRPNQPANVVETGRAMAQARGVTYEELESVVDSNAARAFAW
jgi:TatD DNase family protein